MSENAEHQLSNFKRATYILGTILFLIIGWVWYVNNFYSFVYSNNFMNSCIAQGGSESSCGCALDYVKDNYSFREAKSFDSGSGVPAQLTNYVGSNCV